jgi:hypothetical protein
LKVARFWMLHLSRFETTYLDDLKKPRDGHDVSTSDLQRKVNTWLLRHGHPDAGKAREDRNQGPEGGSDRNGHPEFGRLQVKCPKLSYTTKKHSLHEIFGYARRTWAWLRQPVFRNPSLHGDLDGSGQSKNRTPAEHVQFSIFATRARRLVRVLSFRSDVKTYFETSPWGVFRTKTDTRLQESTTLTSALQVIRIEWS